MIFIFVAIALILTVYISIKIFLNLPRFGRLPSGELAEKIHRSPNYRNGAFQNISETPSLAEGATYSKIIREFFFVKHPHVRPESMIPSVKTDLKILKNYEDIFVWFGHSSYFIQSDGKRFLVDPVFSGAASPIRFLNKSFPGSDAYLAEDLPEIDLLFITHDHWDHLDHQTVLKLKPKIKRIVCGLGVSSHLLRWGFDTRIITEMDWNEEIIFEKGFKINSIPARHFSGRTFKRNQTLWLSFVLTTPTRKLYLGGDSGYAEHFSEAGKKFGPFDLAILECGQYDKNWRYIHMLPDEVYKAATELNTRKLIIVHWGKFKLANHPWKEPPEKLSAMSVNSATILLTPMIGEKVDLYSDKVFSQWWKNVI